jgi:hypothetical protein
MPSFKQGLSLLFVEPRVCGSGDMSHSQGSPHRSLKMVFFFLVELGLELRTLPCKAGAVPLEPHLQPLPEYLDGFVLCHKTPQTFISHSSGSPRPRCRLVQVLVRAPFPVWTAASHCVLTWQKETKGRASTLVSLQKH